MDKDTNNVIIFGGVKFMLNYVRRAEVYTKLINMFKYVQRDDLPLKYVV